MDDQDPADEQRRAQAAQWFARLKTVPVSRGTLESFFEWRKDPANAEAFAQAEQVWGEAGRIGATLAMLRLADAAMAREKRPRARWPLVPAVMLGAGLLVALVAGSWHLFVRAPDLDIATAVGERRSLALSDGSQLQVNTDTRLDARLGRSERRIRIDEGEALFEVAHDRDRPFRVMAGDVEVVATGTRFDVRHVGGQTLVALFEGGVDISVAGRPAVRLQPGQQWRSDDPTATTRQRADARVTAWTQGRVVFDAMPLGQAVDEINRYTVDKVVLAARSRADAPISGSFTTADPSGFVKAVAAMLGLEVGGRAGGGFILREPAAPKH